MRFVRQASKGLGSLERGRLGVRGSGRAGMASRHRALGPGKVHDDKKPEEECEQDELREK